MLLLLALASMVVGRFAADSIGWIDLDYSGYPSYIKDAKPPDAKFLEREHCCGGAADWSGVTQFFYGSDEPFEQVVDRYTSELELRGFSAAVVPPDRTWLSGEMETRFEKPDYAPCLSLAPFTSNYDLDEGLWSSDGVSLREDLANSRIRTCCCSGGPATADRS